MTKTLGAVLALSVTLTLGACSTLEDALLGPGGTVSAVPKGTAPAPTSTQLPAKRATSAAPSTEGAAQTGSSQTGSTQAGSNPTGADQSTPEGAMTAWLTALVGGDGVAACALMASDGAAVSSIKGATEECARELTPRLGALGELRGAFDGLSIAGATVMDDLATFEAATVRPELAAQVVHRYKAVRIKANWYVSE